MADQYRRDYLTRRMAAMVTERASFISHYKELAEFIKPRRGRFFTSDHNRGEKRHNSIINSRASQAYKICVSGLLAGTMSPARPWFAWQTHDPDLMEYLPVKEWLYKAELLIRTILNQSNFYNMAPVFLGEAVLFGTAAMSEVDDFQDVARFYAHTAGSYVLSQNDRFEVDTLGREFEWTVEQVVGKFGYKNCSVGVQGQYDRGNYSAWAKVSHFVEPNPDAKPGNKLARFKPFRSCYYEPGNPNKDQYLSESGYDEFPTFVMRWEVTEEDVYATDCPGMTALGDVKGLQIAEKEKAKAVQKMVAPPLRGPSSLRNVPISGLPGGATLYDSDGDRGKLEPIYNVNPQVRELRGDMDAIERRINEAFLVDLFKAITDMEGIQPRNEFDLSKRDEERLIQIGPALQQLHGPFLGKMLNRTFNMCVRNNLLPPAPPELQGQELQPDYISTLAMAQRYTATTSIDRTVAFAGNLAKAGWTGAMDKIDADQAVDEYALAIGGPPRLIVPDDVIAERRAQREKQTQAAQAMQMANMGADTANKLANSPTGEPNALTNMAQAMQK